MKYKNNNKNLLYIILILLFIIYFGYKLYYRIEKFTNPNIDINDIQILVLHYTPLVDRKENMIKQLNGYNYNFIIEHDREKLSKEDLIKFDTNKLKMAEISIFMKNIYAYNKIINNYNYALLLEDDVILDDNFNEKFNRYIKGLPSDWDMVYIGTCSNIHIDNKLLENDKHIYLGGGTRCGDGFMITKESAKKIVNYFNSVDYIDLPIDHWLNVPIKKLNLKVYWMEPNIVKQGSEINLYKSSIR
jgi:GR25 family glycosyltransferase involved in LPS biosynthesis